MQIKIKLPDSSVHKAKKGLTGKELAEEFKLKRMFAMKIDGELKDLNTKLEKDCSLEFLDFSTLEGKEVFWHSAAHVLAQAVIRLFPKARLTIGPPVEEGFYYDIDHEPFTKEDLEKIEAEMKKIVKEKLSFERVELTKKKALELFKDNPFKLEMVEEFGKDLSAYKQGKFIDLCRGPHVPDTGWFKGLKVLKVAGAYWRGDQKNKQLQRIYAIAFPEKDQLKAWVKVREEAEKRDHRRLGRELDLFSFHEEAPGMAFWHPKGIVLWNTLMEFWREEHRKEGYDEISTPQILNKKLWEKSGHWDNFRENMYFTKIDNVDFAVKPMNCPGGMLVYKRKTWSYRDLPMRVAEVGLVHRHELSGVLSGLFRVRCFTQDDAHIFMTEKQMMGEIVNLLKFTDKIYTVFGFDYHVELSTMPEKAMGDKKTWDMAEAVLKKAMDKVGWKYQINEGDGAFYGPKIDFHLKDAVGRSWQCGTVQLDFQMPECFDLEYVEADGKKRRPIMLHRVVYGAVERFIAVLIEHYAGRFPVWLAPVQVRILTIADRFEKYADEVKAFLEEEGLRVEVDARPESIGKKVREAQLQKIPLILTVGEKELAKKTLAVRTLDGKVTFGLSWKKFRDTVMKAVKEKNQKIKFGK